MANEQELQLIVAQQRAELDQIREASKRNTVDGALHEALKEAGVDPVAAPQLVELLRPQVGIVNDLTGRPVVCGAGLKPVRDLVREKLDAPDFGHFPRSTPSTSSGSSTPAPLTSNGMNAAEYIMAKAAEHKAKASADPRADIGASMLFGVRKR
jgi:hypothetical protein